MLNSFLKNSSWAWVWMILIGVIAGMWVAVWNGYPLVYSDTGAYLDMAFRHRIGVDRSMYYGYFARHVSLRYSLWLVIGAQALLMSWMVMLLVRTYAGALKVSLGFALWALLAGATAYSFTTGVLLPDFSSPASFAAITLLLRPSQLRRYERWVLIPVSVFAIGSHLSNIPVMAALVGLLWVYLVYSSIKGSEAGIKRTDLIRVTAIVIVAIFALPTANWAVGGAFRLTKNSHRDAFAINHLIELGILQDYLNRACQDEESYALCAFRSELGYNFLWDPESPLVKLGGKEAMAEEFSALLDEVYSDRHYQWLLVRSAITSTLAQIVSFDATDIGPQRDGTAPYGQVAWHYKKELQAYIDARQYQGTLHYRLVNTLQQWLMLGSSLIVLSLLLIPGLRRQLAVRVRLFGWLTMLFYVLNAFFCATLSTVDMRYSSRVAWLIPLAAFCLTAALPRKGSQRHPLASGTGPEI